MSHVRGAPASAVLFTAAVLALAGAAACEDEHLRGAGAGDAAVRAADAVGAADAVESDDDASRADTGKGRPDASEADEDAATDDAALRDDAAATDAATDDAALDAGTTDAGEPPMTQVLVVDPVANAVLLVDAQGALVRAYPSPIAGVHGVAFDRRLRDGFWVTGAGSANPLFTKIAWSGAVVGRHDYAPDRLFQFREDGVKSLDYAVGGTAAEDALAFLFTNSNNIDVHGLAPLAQPGGWVGETGLALQLGFFGVHVVAFSLSNTSALDFWTTRDGRIERWGWASQMPAASLSTGATALGGVAIAADGTLWVTDAVQNTLRHLSATGAALGAVPLPGQGAGDLSLVE